jgi:hypothetical protein
MKQSEVLTDSFSRIKRILDMALADLTPEDLTQRPGPESNPIGWLTWHLTRGQDRQIADLAGWEQVWVKGNWHEKLGLPPDPNDMGTGHTAEQVASVRPPSAQLLLDYHDATFEQTKAYLEPLRGDDLDRVLDETRFDPPPTAGIRIISIIADNLSHAGQVAYVKGLLQGKRWYPA